MRWPMPRSRWLTLVTLVAVIVLGASFAQAQVFRPRNGKAAAVNKAAMAAIATSATPVMAAAATPATARKTGAVAAAPAATPAKKAALAGQRQGQGQGNQGKKQRG